MMGRLIFLDFDGVLRRTTSNPARFDPDCLAHFESAMRQCEKSKIVISSTWRLVHPLSELRKRFSPDIARRIVGITPENTDGEDYERYAEIRAFLEQRGIRNMPWLAIDDDPAHFPKGSPLLLTDPLNGFSAADATRLADILRE